VNGDLAIDFDDAAAVARAVGSQRGDARYVIARDLDADGAIDETDLRLVTGNWGAVARPPDVRAPVAAGHLAPAANHRLEATPLDLRQVSQVSVRAVALPDHVVAGQPVTVEVHALDVARLAAFDVAVHVDPRIARARDLDPGTPGTQGAVAELFPPGTYAGFVNLVDALTGRLELAAGLLGDRPGINADGTLARYVFDTLRPGGTDLRILVAELRDDSWPVPARLPVAIAHGSLDVLPVPTAGTPGATPATGTPGTPDTPSPGVTPATGTPSPSPLPTTATPTTPGTPGTAGTPSATAPGTPGTPSGSPTSSDGAERRIFAPAVYNRAPI
jgi:hypothetical protein